VSPSKVIPWQENDRACTGNLLHALTRCHLLQEQINEIVSEEQTYPLLALPMTESTLGSPTAIGSVSLTPHTEMRHLWLATLGQEIPLLARPLNKSMTDKRECFFGPPLSGSCVCE